MATQASVAEFTTQLHRLLRIETVLDPVEHNMVGDPLLLTKFDGEEGFSIPYQYDVVMYRSAEKNKKHRIEPNMLVGTKALIHIRGEDPECDNFPLKLTRQGIFLTFEQLESDQPDDYVKYGARLVPPIKLLDYESGFRVFEQISVLDILKQVLITGTTIPIDTLDFSALDKEQQDHPNTFPRLEYCVQFGETTFNFVSRLMAEYGIWYYFGQNEVDRNINSTTIHNELMIFGHNALITTPTRSETLGLHMRITNDSPEFPVNREVIDFGGSVGWTVSSWRRTYTAPPFLQLDVGNFNQLKPSDPIDASNRVLPDHNTFTTTNPPAFDPARLLRQTFPTPSESNDRSVGSGTAKEFEDAKGYADTRIRDAEANVSVVSGVSKNPTFIPGTIFTVDADLTGRELVPAGFVLRWVRTSAFDLNYDFLTTSTVLSDVWNKSTSQFKTIDATLGIVGQGLQEWMSNYVEQQVDFDVGQLVRPDSKFWTFNLAGGLAYALTSALATSGTQLLHDLLDSHSGFSNSFSCFPNSSTFAPPLPVGTKPRALGVHLALVIGPDQSDELDTSQGDIFADQFGRVRVRFPWDKTGFLLRPDIAGANTRPAAWVRVSEGWAGRQFGTQFLPRIGQEVIVDFIDGDPDGPIITGRVYNSDHGFANLPFPARQVDTEVVTLDDWLKPTGSSDFRFAGLKSNSMPDSKGKPRYHLQRLDDTLNCEQYLLRSQGRLDVTAFAHSFETTYGNKNVKVAEGKDKDGAPFGGSMFTTVGGEYDLHVGGSRYEQVEKNYEVTVKGNVSLDFKQKLSAVVKGVASLAADSIVLEATNKITLKVGGSYVVIGPCGVYINGPMVYINSGGSPDSAASVTMQDIADATAAEPGDQPNKRTTDCNPHQGGGGSRSVHTDQIDPAPPCTLDNDNKICVDPLSGGSSQVPSSGGGGSGGPAGGAGGGGSSGDGGSGGPAAGAGGGGSSDYGGKGVPSGGVGGDGKGL